MEGTVIVAIISAGVAIFGIIFEHVWVLKRLGSFKNSQLEAQIGCSDKNTPSITAQIGCASKNTLSLTDQHKHMERKMEKYLGCSDKNIPSLTAQIGCASKNMPSLTKQHQDLSDQSKAISQTVSNIADKMNAEEIRREALKAHSPPQAVDAAKIIESVNLLQKLLAQSLVEKTELKQEIEALRLENKQLAEKLQKIHNQNRTRNEDLCR